MTMNQKQGMVELLANRQFDAGNLWSVKDQRVYLEQHFHTYHLDRNQLDQFRQDIPLPSCCGYLVLSYACPIAWFTYPHSYWRLAQVDYSTQTTNRHIKKVRETLALTGYRVLEPGEDISESLGC